MKSTTDISVSKTCLGYCSCVFTSFPWFMPNISTQYSLDLQHQNIKRWGSSTFNSPSNMPGHKVPAYSIKLAGSCVYHRNMVFPSVYFMIFFLFTSHFLSYKRSSALGQFVIHRGLIISVIQVCFFIISVIKLLYSFKLNCESLLKISGR